MTYELTKAVARQEAQRLISLGLPVIEFTTSDATPVIVPEATVILNDYTYGKIKYEVIAVFEDGSANLSSERIVGVFKDTALTLGTPDSLHDDDSTTATYLIVDDGSDNVGIELRGVAATNILWRIRVTSFLTTITIEPVLP